MQLDIEKIFYILGGLIIIAFGIFIIIHPKIYEYGQAVDLTGYNIPLGILIIIMGAYLIWIQFKQNE